MILPEVLYGELLFPGCEVGGKEISGAFAPCRSFHKRDDALLFLLQIFPKNIAFLHQTMKNRQIDAEI